MLVLCGGTQVSFGGHEIIAAVGPVSYVEVFRENGSVQVLGANSNAIILRDPGLQTLISNDSALSMTVAERVST